jgi:hypothetical protein
MNEFVIIPTGDEIRSGVVTDTNSPAILGLILDYYPQARVSRIPPVTDKCHELARQIRLHSNSDLIIVIGGSGGGKEFDEGLAVDITHVVMSTLLDSKYVKEIYGFNGHLWCRLLIGRFGDTLVANVPGPYTEAVAAARVLIEGIAKQAGLETISAEMAQAVFAKYPAGGSMR